MPGHPRICPSREPAAYGPFLAEARATASDITALAEAELEEAADRYEESVPGLALEFLADIRHALLPINRDDVGLYGVVSRVRRVGGCHEALEEVPLSAIAVVTAGT